MAETTAEEKGVMGQKEEEEEREKFFFFNGVRRSLPKRQVHFINDIIKTLSNSYVVVLSFDTCHLSYVNLSIFALFGTKSDSFSSFSFFFYRFYEVPPITYDRVTSSSVKPLLNQVNPATWPCC